MTTLTDTQVITASGGLVELGYSQITSNVGVSGTTAGSPTVIVSDLTFVSDGGPLLIEFSAPYAALTTSGTGSVTFGFWIDGAQYSQPSGVYEGQTGTISVPVHAKQRVTLSAGSHTVRVVAYRSGTAATVYAGSGTTGADAPAFLRVSKIVTATQWPAVTTGTIICTSSTRPASPFEGQTIYETNTSLSRIYNGSAWVAPQYQTRVPALSYYWSNVSTTGFSQLVVSGAPTTTQYDSGDISYNSSTGVFTLPKNGLYMASFYASPVRGSGYFPVTISVDPASGATQTPTYIGNSYSGAGWASYTTMNASGIFAANGDRQIRFRIYTSATSGFEAFVRLAWISST